MGHVGGVATLRNGMNSMHVCVCVCVGELECRLHWDVDACGRRCVCGAN